MFVTNKLEVHSKLLESISPLETSSLHERSQDTVLLASTQAVYKAPHSTVRHTF